MLFSALVDADYLDTEAYYSPQAVNQRCNWATLEQLEPVFINYMVNKQNAANKNCINLLRMDIYKNCLEAARQKTGLFSLSVPTGGGKTLSSMAFAFAHAKKHGMKRIIYAIPFTSIIEQNAAVFREALGDRAVLEHHSHYNFEDDLEGTERLAAENWDAPVIVTTNVQLFESLFENKPSKCRKLHNLAQSVIVLDEMQTLPDGLLKPCLAALQCLCEDFGASVVMCTATQPAVDFVWPDPAEVREIVADPSGLYSAFKKVDVSYLGVVDNKDLVERIRKDKQVLCIVNTRKHARELYKILSESEEEGIFHLSALMCPEHRTLKLDAIRDRLKDGLLCRVISTQLIEAGVDIDFPVVYRAAAGIDSIAQAAGRCNREGKLKKGETFVFYPPDGVPSGWFQRMAALGAEIMKSGADPLSMETVKHFFQRRYSDAGLGGLDEHDILGQCKNGMRYLEFPFEQMAREFHFIPSAGKQVIIPFDVQCREILREAEESVHSWQFARLLQKYTVTVYPYEFEQMMRAGIIKQIGEAFISLQTDSAGYRNIYSDATGLNIEPEKEILVI
jgi:CRISPR-associated helicase Cas3